MSPVRLVPLDQLQQFAAVNLSSDPGAIGGPVQVPQCAQITLRWGLESGKVGHNVLYGRYSGGFAGTVAQAQAIFSALSGSAFTSNIGPQLAASSSLQGVDIRDVNQINQPIISSTGAAVPGTSASPALPNEVALVVTLRTGQVGRSMRGRLYIPGWATNALGAGNVAAAAVVTALNNWAGQLTPTLAAQGYTFVIGQRARAAYTGVSGTQHPARAATSTQITSTTVRDNHWDSQRRRGLK